MSVSPISVLVFRKYYQHHISFQKLVNGAVQERMKEAESQARVAVL